ncbi:hypothetical protein P691DRAFT_786624 [Macrolepiota fuliginosa MF-IS2]|uniref:Uncharacterized protein n=1 Tax=Macrolepiota fuliginosa MF-IS2 TaxID=1400762 RepID=A0A9P5X828_9AGAR|nr:hypothetical protein P691DRAFT_786624 [Macrolepiota fuliginosa MF-IS2]
MNSKVMRNTSIWMCDRIQICVPKLNELAETVEGTGGRSQKVTFALRGISEDALPKKSLMFREDNTGLYITIHESSHPSGRRCDGFSISLAPLIPQKVDFQFFRTNSSMPASSAAQYIRGAIFTKRQTTSGREFVAEGREPLGVLWAAYDL